MQCVCESVCSAFGQVCQLLSMCCGRVCGCCCCSASECACAPARCPNLAFSEQIEALRAKQVKHLIVFFHGICSDGPRDYRYLRDRVGSVLAEDGVGVYLALYCSSTSPCCASACSLALTANGIDAVTQRGGAELQAVLTELKQHVTTLSIVGHSMGGLAARGVARKIMLGQIPAASSLSLRHFILLASPAIGVRHTFGIERILPSKVCCGCCTACCRACVAAAAQRCVPFGRDVFLTSGTLEALTDTDSVESLKRFESRFVFAPLYDDRIVSYETASLGCKKEPRGDSFASECGPASEQPVWPEASAGSGLEAELRRRLLEAGEWQLVAFRGNHSQAGIVSAVRMPQTYSSGDRLGAKFGPGVKFVEVFIRYIADADTSDVASLAGAKRPTKEPRWWWQAPDPVSTAASSSAEPAQPGYADDAQDQWLQLVRERYGFVIWLAQQKELKGEDYPTDRPWLSWAAPSSECSSGSWLDNAIGNETRAKDARVAFVSEYGLCDDWRECVPTPEAYRALFKDGARSIAAHGYNFELPQLDAPSPAPY
eukprot:TRINITY_DN14470_c0_g1_i1.p1 TRINITY_DN14470_c0_g1~~TRINITY_DN14470_c0_g1_i1.p1  ORF type:complete len:543 (+),score=53.58 TRINITY_DN14470_c0_g1_i1:121-1749(+)